MSQSAFETSERVLKFDSKAKGRSDVTPSTTRGRLSLREIRTAADLANQDCDRAMSLTHKLSMELRRKIERVSYWRKWSFGATAQLAPKNGCEQFRKRSRTSSSFGDRTGIEETILHR